MTSVYRTPPERFEGLPDFAFEPSYRDLGGLRLAHVDVGHGPPVVMLHGEPTWSFIWRNVIPPIRDAGYRCVAPDLAGFGRSDKPLDPGWHSLERHVELTKSLLVDLDLRDATLVVHDWGGPVGIRVALAQPERVARIVVLDTAIDFRDAWKSDVWVRFRDWVEGTEDLPVAGMMRATCFRDPAEEVLAGYEAPFPVLESKAAMTGLPMSVPPPDDARAAAEGDAVLEALRSDPRPMLLLWGADDLIFTLASAQRAASRIGRRIDHVVPEAAHGLPEDQGALVGRLVADWLAS